MSRSAVLRTFGLREVAVPKRSDLDTRRPPTHRDAIGAHRRHKGGRDASEGDADDYQHASWRRRVDLVGDRCQQYEQHRAHGRDKTSRERPLTVLDADSPPVARKPRRKTIRSRALRADDFGEVDIPVLLVLANRVETQQVRSARYLTPVDYIVSGTDPGGRDVHQPNKHAAPSIVVYLWTSRLYHKIHLF
jgi:hypothetical protein